MLCRPPCIFVIHGVTKSYLLVRSGEKREKEKEKKAFLLALCMYNTYDMYMDPLVGNIYI